MKKVFILILLIALLSLSACGGKKTYTVSFETNGGSSLESIKVSQNKPIKNLEVPTKEYHIFKGWYFDNQFEEAFINSFTVEEDIVLYAKWEPIQYSIYLNFNGGLINDQRYLVITKPFGATFELPTPKNDHGTFLGWYEMQTGKRYEPSTMSAEDMSLIYNLSHYPQVFLPSDYSDGKDDGQGGITLYNEEELKTQRLRNLKTFEERFRGNTTFNYDLIKDPVTENLVLTPLYTGYTYSKACADYIEKNSLARVEKRSDDWWDLNDVSLDLLNGYGVHMNCENSPLTNNPFMSKYDYKNLLKYYTIELINGIKVRQIDSTIDFSELYGLYRILYTSHPQKDNETLIPVVDEMGNPIIRGGYHALDKDGHFMYDENGKPIQKLYKFEPKDNYKPVYSKVLFAKWSTNPYYD